MTAAQDVRRLRDALDSLLMQAQYEDVDPAEVKAAASALLAAPSGKPTSCPKGDRVADTFNEGDTNWEPCTSRATRYPDGSVLCEAGHIA